MFIHLINLKKDLEWHRINNIECIFAPDWAKLKENIKFEFKLDISKLRHSISHTSSNSWVKSKKKILQNEYYIGVKSLFHSLRIPLFAIQICKYGKIKDFTCANHLWNKLKNDRFTWDSLDKEFRPIRNEILTEFRKVSVK